MSGSTIGGLAGAAIGGYFGGSQGAQIGWMIGSAVGGYVDPDVIKGPRLSDSQALTVQEGAFRAIVYGTAVVGGNIIQCGPLVEHKHKHRTGKGGPVQVDYTYTRTVAIAIGEGPIAGILRIWQDGKLVYDARDPNEWPDAADAIRSMAADTSKFASTFTFYSGSETQMPDPSLEALDPSWGGGAGNVPAYRGTAYIVFPNLDVTNGSGAVSQYRFEVACCGTTTTSINDVPWVHGDTGLAQHIYAVGIYQNVAIAAGENNNLRRTDDGGRTWQSVDYTAATGWDPATPIVAVMHKEDPSVGPQGIWYIATQTSMAASYDAGHSFTSYGTLAHSLPFYTGGLFFKVGGTILAPAADTTNTAIFEPLILPDTTLRNTGGSYGTPLSICDYNGAALIGTSTGKIVNQSGGVLYSHPSATEIRNMATDGLVVLARLGAGGYVRYDGSAWTVYAGATVQQFAYARGVFYRALTTGIEASHDQGLTWASVDTSFASNAYEVYLASDGYSVLAVTGFGMTAALPSAYVLPDVAGWFVDILGNITGATTITTDRCDANVADIVADQCARVGIPASRVDVSGITDTVRGFVVGKQGAATDNIRPLQSAFFFDFPEWGDSADLMTKLRAIKRGGAAKVTITDEDLVWSEDDQETRAQAVEFPRKINLITADVDADYNPTKQTAERQTQDVKAVGESTVELAIACTRNEAAPIADKMLKVAWTEAEGTWERELPAEFTRYTPSDCFLYSGQRWRIEQAEQRDGTVKWTAKRDRPSAYTSTASAANPIAPAPPNLSLRGPTVFAAMNLPSLRSADNVPGMYIFVCGLLDGWAGCDLQMATEVSPGVPGPFASVATITSESTMGDLTANCGTTEPISVRVLHGHTLESVAASQLESHANAFAVVTAGTAEVGQFQTATESVSGYDLTDVARGQLGTTAAAHRAGDRFVLLDGRQTFLPLDVSLAGKTLWFRPVSLGTVPANNATYPIDFRPLFTTTQPVIYLLDEAGNQLLAEDGAYLQQE